MRGLVHAVLISTAVSFASGSAVAAPPACEKITVEDLRNACMERAKRCEPVKNAVDRDLCYRGPSSREASPRPEPIVPARAMDKPEAPAARPLGR